jgi:hypothetical protein
MVLQRSPKAMKAKSVFFQSFNDVDIYVEDNSHGTIKLYSVIFERVMEGAFRVETVFPVGNKSAVISQCASDQEPGGRPRLYVVDGDLALLTGRNPKGLRRLLVLKKYSIENFLIDHHAITTLLNEEDLEKSAAEIRAAFSFDEWVDAIGFGLFNLFVLYAIASEVVPTRATVSFPVRNLVGSPVGFIDDEKLQKRMSEITELILSVLTQDELKARVKSMVHYAKFVTSNRLSFVSGKDYLMPLVLMRMRSVSKLRADNAVIKQRLAMKCDVSELAVAGEIVS